MRVGNARELGLLIRERRRGRGWSQAELARRMGVSRHWVMEVERGKPTAELGLVLAALSELDLVCDVRDRGVVDRGVRAGTEAGAQVPDVALSGVLSRARGQRLRPPGEMRREAARASDRGTKKEEGPR